jgi:hypothetical protein
MVLVRGNGMIDLARGLALSLRLCRVAHIQL